MGFIAEEVGKVLPSVVDWDKAEPGYAEGYDHISILALAVQAVKELTTQNSELQSQFSEQQTTIEAMKKQFKMELDALRSEVMELKQPLKN
jgi:malate synthase